mmetsp:Transcript_9302/g.12614  ORF Transcript_9302/g.12614 Transcript_9302/m.12614 type:complete len:190 (+) Transcript_9302:84-653(+)
MTSVLQIRSILAANLEYKNIRPVQNCGASRSFSLPSKKVGFKTQSWQCSRPRSIQLKAAAEEKTECDLNDEPEEEIVLPEMQVGGITEVMHNTFFPVCAATDEIVVLDCFTEWCGPCKMIYPKLLAMANKYEGKVTFTKMNCNSNNKPLAKELGVKVVPTFYIFKNGNQVDTMVGAKVDVLEEKIVAQL